MPTLRGIRQLLGKVLNDRQPDAEKNTPETEWRRQRDIWDRLRLISTALIALVEEIEASRATTEAAEQLWKETQDVVRVVDPAGEISGGNTPPGPGLPGHPGQNYGYGERTLRSILNLLGNAFARGKDSEGSLELVRGAVHSIVGDLQGFQLQVRDRFIELDGDYVEKATLTAKGSMIAASAASTPAEVVVGTNGQVVTADSAQSAGVKFSNDRFAARFTTAATFDQRDLGVIIGPALTTVSVAVGTLVAYPFWVPDERAFDRIEFEVTAVGGAGAKGRVGIYENNSETNPRPAALVYDGGEFAVDAGTIKSNTPVSQVILQRGWYWRAYLCGTAAPTVRGVIPGSISSLLGLASTWGGNMACGVSRAFAYAALPNPFGTGGLALRTANMPAVGLRWSA